MEKNNRLQQIIEDILEDANEDLALEHSEVVSGGLMIYAHVLKIIQEQLTEEERKAYKLDFDIDARYM